MYGMFFLGALYLERVLGYEPLEIGLAFLPSTIIMGGLSIRYTERLVMRFGPKTTLLPGLFLILAGLLLFMRAPVDGDYVSHVLPVMVLLGAGVGTAFPSLMTLAMSGATEEDAGLASGLVNTTVQVGAALGLAVLATLSTTRTETPARLGRVGGRGAQRRLPPRLRDRRRPGAAGDRRRGDRAPAGPGRGARRRGRRRAGASLRPACEPAYEAA